jgi:prepilin-type processing-associated H-X9-DG protein
MAIVYTCPRCGQQTSVDDRFAGCRGVCANCRSPVNIPAASETGALAGPSADYVPQKKKTSPWLIVLALVGGFFVLLFCSGIPVALLLPAVSSAREAGRRAACSNNLRQISLAMLNYENNFKQFPPASKTDGDGPAMSWRVAILPYLDEQSLYQQYDPKQPWDSPHNRKLLDTVPREFRCPSNPSAGSSETDYVMVVGPHTVGGDPGSKGVGMPDITDGMSNTLLIVEVHGLGIKWTEPRDITLKELIANMQSGKSPHPRGFNVAFCDGSVQFVPVTIDAETLRRLATIDDGQSVAIPDLD